MTQQQQPILSYSRLAQSEPSEGVPVRHAVNKAFAGVTWAILAIVLVVWAVVGAVFWIPLMLRTVLQFSLSHLKSVFVGKRPEGAARALQSAVSFYRRGFVVAFEVIMREEIDGNAKDPETGNLRLVSDSLRGRRDPGFTGGSLERFRVHPMGSTPGEFVRLVPRVGNELNQGWEGVPRQGGFLERAAPLDRCGKWRQGSDTLGGDPLPPYGGGDRFLGLGPTFCAAGLRAMPSPPRSRRGRWRKPTGICTGSTSTTGTTPSLSSLPWPRTCTGRLGRTPTWRPSSPKP